MAYCLIKKIILKKEILINTGMLATLKKYIMRNKTVRYWDDKKDKLKQKYENLTDKDLSFNLGNEKEMIEMLGQKLGITKQELLKIIITL